MKAFTVLAAIVGTVAAKRDGYAYIDDWNCQSASCFVPYVKSVVTTGLNNVLLAFAMPVGSTEDPSWYWDSTRAYYQLTDAQRSEVGAHYAQYDAKLWMSIGGGTYPTATYLAQDPAVISRAACQRAKDHGYYGVDFDLEFVSTDNWGAFLPWAITASTTCADVIGHIAHAPQVPYLGAWLNFGYEKLIPYAEHFLTQYYNQGPSRPYTNEAAMWAQTNDGGFESWTDIIQRNALYKNLVVIGKYIRPAHGGFGLVSAAEFDALLKIGEDKYGYNNGYMIWKVPMAEEAGDLNTFLNSDIPKLAAGGGTGPTVSTTTSTSTVASASSTTSPGGVNPPSTPSAVTTTTSTATTTTSVGGGNPGPGPSDMVGHCQSVLTSASNPDWAANCKELCAYYGSAPAFCPGAATGEALAACVLTNHGAQCAHI